jgi:hypothetical protein
MKDEIRNEVIRISIIYSYFIKNKDKSEDKEGI